VCFAGRDLRQPRVEPRDRVVELARDALLARGVIARYRAGDLFDLAGNRIEPLVNVGDVMALRQGVRRSGGVDAPTVELSQSFNDMPARRAAASARSRTEGSIPSTLHDTREFMLPSGFDSGAPPSTFSPSRASRGQDKSNSAQVSGSRLDFCGLR